MAALSSRDASLCAEQGLLHEFITNQLLPGIQEARRLRAVEDDDKEPYKSKYLAGDLLSSLAEQAAAIYGKLSASDADCGHIIAYCQLERGLVLLETDLTAEGQRALEQSLQYTWPTTLESYAAQQQACNALGGLWCSREEFDRSLHHLNMAAELYRTISTPQCSSSSSSMTLPAPAEPPRQAQDEQQEQPQLSSRGTSWVAILTDMSKVDTHYTATLYYMAQVYGHAGDKVQSASYCAATLNRQLKEGDAGAINVNEWVQNCLQLSGYFLDGNAFALSQYCCAAVEKMLLQWHGQQQQDTPHPDATCNDQRQQQQQEVGGQPAEAVAGIAGISISSEAADTNTVGARQQQQQQEQQQQQQEQQPDSQSKDQAAKQQQATAVSKDTLKGDQLQLVSQQGGSSRPLQAALQCLDEDVAANVRLAFAKLHLYTLVASHERYVEGRHLSYSFAAPADVPAVLAFDALPGLPELSSLAWGDAALAPTAGAALGLFKAALPWFHEALEYYKLEGWVTEHCNILFELSNLYRCLAGFEADPHKRCVMHRQRAKLLQPLEGELSPQHYPGLSRSISLELGNIFREIGDIKAAAAREPGKVAAAAVAACKHYQLFLDSFQQPDGSWPDKVEQEMEQHYLSAVFCMARVLQASAIQYREPSAHIAALEQAASWLDRLATYVEKNSVAAFEQEAQLAKEMVALLEEKLALTKQRFIVQRSASLEL